MIEGVVNEWTEAVITLAVRGPSGQTAQVDVVVDTGFSDFLFLPSSFVSELELVNPARQDYILADGSRSTVDVYNVWALWDGRWKRVETGVSDAIPLVGMLMLEGHDLNIEVEVGGRVAIRARE